MTHRNEQPALFELTGCDEFEAPWGLPSERSAPRVDPESDLPPREGDVSTGGWFTLCANLYSLESLYLPQVVEKSGGPGGVRTLDLMTARHVKSMAGVDSKGP